MLPDSLESGFLYKQRLKLLEKHDKMGLGCLV